MNQAEKLIKQIDNLLDRFPSIEDSWYSSSLGGFFKDNTGYESLMTEILSLIPYIYQQGHPNSQRVISGYNQHSLKGLKDVKGILLGTKNNIENGFIDDLRENITLDIKTDFLNAAKNFAKKIESENLNEALTLKKKYKLPRKVTIIPARKVYNILKSSGYIKLANQISEDYEISEENLIKRKLKKLLQKT